MINYIFLWVFIIIIFIINKIMENLRIKKLKNGLKVLPIPNNFFNSTYIRLYVKIGSRYEQKNEKGFSHLVEHIISKKAYEFFKSKDNWTDDPVLECFNCKTMDSYTCYSFEIHKSDLYKGIKLIGEILSNNNLSAINLKNEKEIIINEIYEERDDFYYRTRNIFRKNYYKNNNLKNSILGNISDIKKANKKSIQNFIKKYYQPYNMVLVVSGNIQDENNLLKLIRKKFNFKFFKKTQKNKFSKLKSVKGGVKIIYKQSKQLYINYIRTFFIPDFITRIKWDVFVRIFEQYLFNYIRNKGFSYSLNMNLFDFEEFFNIDLTIIISKKKVFNFITIFKKYIQAFKNNFDDKNLKLVKEELIKSYDIVRDYPKDKAKLFGWQTIMFPNQKLLSIEKIQKTIEQISTKDIIDCFNMFLKVNSFLLITGCLKNNKKIINFY